MLWYPADTLIKAPVKTTKWTLSLEYFNNSYLLPGQEWISAHKWLCLLTADQLFSYWLANTYKDMSQNLYLSI